MCSLADSTPTDLLTLLIRQLLPPKGAADQTTATTHIQEQKRFHTQVKDAHHLRPAFCTVKSGGLYAPNYVLCALIIQANGEEEHSMPGQLACNSVSSISSACLALLCSSLEVFIDHRCITSSSAPPRVASAGCCTFRHIKGPEEVVKMPQYVGASVRDRTAELTGIADRLQRQQVVFPAVPLGVQISL